MFVRNSKRSSWMAGTYLLYASSIFFNRSESFSGESDFNNPDPCCLFDFDVSPVGVGVISGGESTLMSNV